jgi:hypothetical protein
MIRLLCTPESSRHLLLFSQDQIRFIPTEAMKANGIVAERTISDIGTLKDTDKKWNLIFIVFRIEQHSPIDALPAGHQCVLRRNDQPR